MGRENMLTFGKITLVSSGENVEQLMIHLDALIKKHGYPDQYDHGSGNDDDDDFNEVEEELKSDAEKQNPNLGFQFPKKVDDGEE